MRGIDSSSLFIFWTVGGDWQQHYTPGARPRLATSSASTSLCCNMPPNQSFYATLQLSNSDLKSWALASTTTHHDAPDEPLESSDAPKLGHRYKAAVLGCGMMGQEHLSYMSGFAEKVEICYLCDPHVPSLEASMHVLGRFALEKPANGKTESLWPTNRPIVLHNEDDLLEHAAELDLVVIATPNYLHTSSLERWAVHDLTILVEKPVCVNAEQREQLRALQADANTRARIWVAMEYRFIPAVAKLRELLPMVGDIKMVTIRENRYPFLRKVNAWNRDHQKTGDTLVEKCCHFFDLFRLLTAKEAQLDDVRALAQRGLNYENEDLQAADGIPIIDAAYVTFPFQDSDMSLPASGRAIGCLELCMYAEGSRHQEEVIVTGTKGRVEAYLPENSVYLYQRPSNKEWSNRSVPPPPPVPQIWNCNDVKSIHGILEGEELPTHGGYHYCSTAVEWYKLLAAMKNYDESGEWIPAVSLDDGIKAVEMGLRATSNIVNL